MFRFTLLSLFLGVCWAAGRVDHTPWFHVYIDRESHFSVAVMGSGAGF